MKTPEEVQAQASLIDALGSAIEAITHAEEQLDTVFAEPTEREASARQSMFEAKLDLISALRGYVSKPAKIEVTQARY